MVSGTINAVKLGAAAYLLLGSGILQHLGMFWDNGKSGNCLANIVIRAHCALQVAHKSHGAVFNWNPNQTPTGWSQEPPNPAFMASV